jgi:predicted RecB family endonuclease
LKCWEVTTVKLNKHDRYVKELCSRLKYEYDSISTNIPIIKKKRAVGEIDILAQKGESIDLYEVKCSYRITKAKKQAKSIRKNLNLKIANIYFYCGATASLVLL